MVRFPVALAMSPNDDVLRIGVEQVGAGVSIGGGAGCNRIQIIDREGGGDTVDQMPPQHHFALIRLYA
jgi:hypothetical protein